MSFDRFDLVLLLFPFTEKKGQKQRPAIVLSDRAFGDRHEHSIVAMVTTASLTKWPSDLPIEDFSAAGLNSPSVARVKFFTIANDLVLGRLGSLAANDCRATEAWIASLFPLRTATG